MSPRPARTCLGMHACCAQQDAQHTHTHYAVFMLEGFGWWLCRCARARLLDPCTHARPPPSPLHMHEASAPVPVPALPHTHAAIHSHSTVHTHSSTFSTPQDAPYVLEGFADEFASEETPAKLVGAGVSRSCSVVGSFLSKDVGWWGVRCALSSLRVPTSPGLSHTHTTDLHWASHA